MSSTEITDLLMSEFDARWGEEDWENHVNPSGRELYEIIDDDQEDRFEQGHSQCGICYELTEKCRKFTEDRYARQWTGLMRRNNLTEADVERDRLRPHP